MSPIDRFGVGWRPALAAAVLADRDHLDLVEVVLDDWLARGRAGQDALRLLADAIPVALHGVGLGLASAAPVDRRRLDRLARLVDAVRPDHWSEHLAFVRAAGVEIGHLAAPPRCAATVDGTARNLARVRATVGSAPRLENVATLLEPPGSTMDEVDWLATTLQTTGAEMLLDLHNLHANAINFAFDPAVALARLPLARVRTVHLAGGRWIGPRHRRRLLDDHRHAVPEAVFALLAELGAHAPQPLDVILENDDPDPPWQQMLQDLARARTALAAGRAARAGAA